MQSQKTLELQKEGQAATRTRASRRTLWSGNDFDLNRYTTELFEELVVRPRSRKPQPGISASGSAVNLPVIDTAKMAPRTLPELTLTKGKSGQPNWLFLTSEHNPATLRNRATASIGTNPAVKTGLSRSFRVVLLPKGITRKAVSPQHKAPVQNYSAVSIQPSPHFIPQLKRISEYQSATEARNVVAANPNTLSQPKNPMLQSATFGPKPYNSTVKHQYVQPSSRNSLAPCKPYEKSKFSDSAGKQWSPTAEMNIYCSDHSYSDMATVTPREIQLKLFEPKSTIYFPLPSSRDPTCRPQPGPSSPEGKRSPKDGLQGKSEPAQHTTALSVLQEALRRHAQMRRNDSKV